MQKILIVILSLFTISCKFNQGSVFNDIPSEVTLTQSSKYLAINPYQNAPLSAELRLKKSLNKDLKITVKGQDGEDSDLSYTWKENDRVVFPITGMYFDYTNTIILSSDKNTKIIHVVITNKPSEYIKEIKVLKNNRPNLPERKNFLNFFNPVSKLTDLFATDNYGKIRWYMVSPIEFHGMKFEETNNEIVFSMLNTTKPEIQTYNIAGKHIKTIKGPKKTQFNVPEADKRFHHDMFRRKNGNIIVLDKSQYGVEDAIIELDSKGKIIQEIRIGDWIRKTINGSKDDYTGLELFIFDTNTNPFDEYASGIRYPGMPKEQNAVDWAHINAFSFDEETETLFLSFRQHGIFSFDYKTQELNWIFIRKNYTIPLANRLFYNLPETMQYVYEIPALQPYILKGADGPDHPHAVTYLSNNQLMVFDNSGDDGNYPEEGSRLLVFSVNPTNKTVKIDWEYRHQDTNKKFIYSQVVSDIDKTPFGSYIGVFGTQVPFTFIEVSSTNKEVLFDMRLWLEAENTGNSDIAVPIACPTSRLLQNGILLYRGDYQAIYPSPKYSID